MTSQGGQKLGYDTHFIGPFQITERVGEVAYQIALPLILANLHDVFHVPQLRKYIADLSHVIQVDDVQMKDNLKVEALPVRIEDRKLNQLRGKEIVDRSPFSCNLHH